MRKLPSVSALFQWGNFCKFYGIFLEKMDFIKNEQGSFQNSNKKWQKLNLTRQHFHTFKKKSRLFFCYFFDGHNFIVEINMAYVNPFFVLLVGQFTSPFMERGFNFSILAKE